jgi:hypothetical protein
LRRNEIKEGDSDEQQRDRPFIEKAGFEVAPMMLFEQL